VQVILLDTRFFRSPLKPTDQRNAPGRERYLPDEDPTKTMLGEAQWAWLADRLREPAEVRLIVSSVQVLAEGHGWERWGNFPRERQRLYDLIRDTGARGVVYLSGDATLVASTGEGFRPA
jgi:alkaline phosphatase D